MVTLRSCAQAPLVNTGLEAAAVTAAMPLINSRRVFTRPTDGLLLSVIRFFPEAEGMRWGGIKPWCGYSFSARRV